MGLLTFNDDKLQVLVKQKLARIILKKVVTQLADIISKPPLVTDQRLKNLLSESNINEVYRHASWVALTSQHKASAITVEKNVRDLWTFQAHEISYYERTNFNKLQRIKLLINKVEINGYIRKLVREYKLIYKNKKPDHVEMSYSVEDEFNGKMENSFLYSTFGLEYNEPIKLDLKVIPVVLCKGHLGDSVSIAERIEDILEMAPVFWETFIQQLKLSGAKFLINSALVETSNVRGESAEEEIVNSLLSGNPVVKAPGQNSNDGAIVENISVVNSLQEFRANLDWLLTAAKEYSLVPDFNSGDKGTANIQTAEVEASQQNKMAHLEAWQRIKEDEWKRLFIIYGLRSGYKPAKEVEIKLDFIKKAEIQQKGSMNNQLNKEKTNGKLSKNNS